MGRSDYEMRRSGHYSSGPVQLSEDSLAAFNKVEQDNAERTGNLSRDERRERRAQREVARRKRFKLLFWIILGLIIVLAVILIPIGVLVIGKQNKPGGSSSSGSNGTTSATHGSPTSASNGGLSSISESSIPTAAKGTYLHPFTWVSTAGFNVTYTNETVGGLYVMGLNSTWDDSTQCNPTVPPLNQPFEYGKKPFRGVDLGGWLVLEPFITPSLFNYPLTDGVVDEYTLSQHLGASQTAQVLENHYATFMVEDDFAQIAAAGLDHVRIPYGYWAVDIQPGDTYLPKISWRYLLRAIEWARKHGLRVNIDLHSVPGNANGWNHSGREGLIGWLNGTDGQKNADISLEYHNRLSTFFAQERYKNVVTLYGLVNEPRMTSLPIEAVLNWTTNAYELVRKNGYEGKVVFGDGFRGLDNWQGALPGMEGLVLDVHEYVIFNTGQLAQTHTGKIQFACSGWGAQINRSMDTATGFGPTMVGEFGQADTDCVPYLNNVGVGSRWEGTLYPGLVPCCPTGNICSCEKANADPSTYSAAYRLFLQMFAIAQMDSFELGYGWMYWTWITETSTQWSYKKGIAAGLMPAIAYQRNWTCSDGIPDFQNNASLALSEAY